MARKTWWGEQGGVRRVGNGRNAVRAFASSPWMGVLWLVEELIPPPFRDPAYSVSTGWQSPRFVDGGSAHEGNSEGPCGRRERRHGRVQGLSVLSGLRGPRGMA